MVVFTRARAPGNY